MSKWHTKFQFNRTIKLEIFYVGLYYYVKSTCLRVLRIYLIHQTNTLLISTSSAIAFYGSNVKDKFTI